MSNTDRETQNVIMAVQKAAFLMDPFFKLTMVGAALLVTYLARMAKEKKISKNEFKNVQEFMKATDGKYMIVNLPYDKNYSPWKAESRIMEGTEKVVLKNEATGEIYLDQKGREQTFGKLNKAEKAAARLNEKENLALEELKQSGITHVVMPDLNKDDGMVQIAVSNDDKEKFTAWMERYVMNRMQGGEKSLRGLTNLSSGRTKIISLPIEGKDAVEAMKNDFGEMKINYSILPDLHVGDSETQIVVPDAEVEGVAFWMKLHNESLLKQGKEVKDMTVMSMANYTKTGEITEEQYIDTASEELKKANEKYEGQEKGEVEKAVMTEEKKIRSESDENYLRYENDPTYQKISIDRETCVEQSHLSAVDKQKAIDNGFFYSRVPGTWYTGNSAPEQTLLIPLEQVFAVNEGNTYYAFIEKEGKPLVLDGRGKLIRGEARMSGSELFERHYDKVSREFTRKTQLEPTQNKAVEKAAGITKERTSHVPMKVK